MQSRADSNSVPWAALLLVASLVATFVALALAFLFAFAIHMERAGLAFAGIALVCTSFFYVSLRRLHSNRSPK